MAVTPVARTWDDLFAARTRGGVGDGIAEILSFLAIPGLISFAGGFPDPLTFPRKRAAQLLAEFADTQEVSAFQYAATRGLAGTLDVFAERIEATQGVRPADDELVITSGGIEALELVSKTFLDTGDGVVVEGPTYLGALMAFRGYGAAITAISIDDDGLRVDELAQRLREGLRPKLLYTIPDFQNPGGVTLSTERREALVELARRYGFLIFEDVAYREIGFHTESPASLWSLAPEVVVQGGTTSKTFCPGTRLGWAAGPAAISARLVSAKQNTDQCASALAQRLFEEYMRRGWLDEQLVASRALYERKCGRLLAALERFMPEGAKWTTPLGGFFSWLTLPEGGDSRLLARRAVEAGVGIVPGTVFFPDGRGGDNVRLSFSMVDEALIEQGIETLAGLV